MVAAPPPPAAPAAPSRWRWVRRGLAVFAALLLLLVLFHRPLGHWAIRHFGGGALEKAGISSEWKTSGSLLGGLEVDDLKLVGKEGSPVKSVTLRHAALDYDLWELRGGGPGKVLKSLTVQHLEAELDFSRPRPPEPPKPKAPPKLPDVVLPEIRIEHVTLRIRLPKDEVLVRDFSLILDPSRPGVIEAAMLDLPGTPPLENLSGTTRLEPQRLILENTSLWPDTVLEKLVLDLADLASTRASVELAARQGAAHATLIGSSGDWFTSPTADAVLETTGLSAETLAFYGVPSGGAEWKTGEARLAAKGPVLHPDTLEVDLKVSDAGVTIGDRVVQNGVILAGMKGGKLTMQELSASLGSSSANVSGSADLPHGWGKIADAPGSVTFTAEAPELSQLVPPSADVEGSAKAEGRVAFADRKLTDATAAVQAAALRIKGIPVESAAADVQLQDGEVQVEALKVQLDPENRLTATGRMELAGARRLSAEWQVDARDLASVPAEAREGLLWPESGRIVSEGKASGSLTEWREGNWTSLNATATADVTGLKLKEARLDSLQLRADAADGAVRVEELSLRLDDENRLDASGQMDLRDAALPLSGNAMLRLPQVARLSAWSEQFGGPALKAGLVELDWKGDGSLKPLDMESSGSVTVRNLKLDGVPELLGLTAEVRQSGSNVDVPVLKASAGPWRAEGSAAWDGWHLTVPGLQVFAEEQRLVDLSARIPWHDGKVPVDSPLSLHLKLDALKAGELADALGKPLPVAGVLNVEGDFSGTLATLDGTLKVSASGLRPTTEAGPAIAPAAVNLTARVEKGRLAVKGTATQEKIKPLTITASLPLDIPALMEDRALLPTLPLSAEVSLPSSPLAFLPEWVPALRSVDGRVEADFTLSGTVGKPVWEGRAEVRAAEAELDSRSLPSVKDLKLVAHIEQNRLRVDEGSVLVAGGRLNFSGEAGLENPGNPQLDFKLTADEILVVRDQNLSLRADASITLQGPFSAAEVKGRIDLVRGRVFKEIEFLPLSLPNSLPPAPPPTEIGKQGAPELPPPFADWKFDITIQTKDPIRLMGNVARGAAVADLRLTGTGEEPVLTGEVRLEDMWLRLPFSRLDITKGVVSFTKEHPFDPGIDIVGESVIDDRVVQVFVQGRALDPEVRLTSSPPLPEGEIATLLATGVTTSDLTSRKDEAAGRAAFVVLKQAYRKLFRKSALESDDDEPPRLSFDFSMFGSDPERRGVSANYELNPNWRVSGRVGETGTFRGLLHYLIRFR